MLTLQERDTRYANVRAKMKEVGFDALLVICDAQIEKKGLLKYLTNYRNTLYNIVAVFPLEGTPKMLVPSPVQLVWAKRLSWINDVVLQKPALEPVLVDTIKEMGLENARFGVASLKIMNAYTFEYLKSNLPGATFGDADKIIDDLRVIKTPAEIELMKETIDLTIKSFEVLGQELKPGITEQEVIAKVDTFLTCNGAQDIFHLILSKPGDIMPFMPTTRKIEKGDAVIVNTEISGPSGYWCQMVRTAFVGKPTDSAKKMYETLKDYCIDELPKLLVPGAKCSDIAKTVIKMTEDAGYKMGVYFGHCQGLDVVEFPKIAVNDDTPLRAGMVLVVHPQFVSQDDQETVWYCDSYLVKEDGPAEILTKTARDFLELDF